MEAVYLKPKSYFIHSFPHSDTLFGAICWGIRLLYGESTLKGILASFANGSPPFLLSSTFPYIDLEEKRIHLLPKPERPPLEKFPTTLEDTERIKDFKKIAYVSSSIFTKIIQGKLSEENLYNFFFNREYIKIGSILMEKELIIKDLSQLIYDVDIPRNAVNRLTGGTIEGRLFYDKSLFLSKNSGIYFFIQFNHSQKLEKQIHTVINFFADRGIGGDVSSGKGQFDVEIKEGTFFTEPENANTFVTLSLYYPNRNDWENFKEDLVWYEQIRRKGKIESAFTPFTDIWKKSVLMFKEGSTFPLIEGVNYYGENPIVKEKPFNIQQYGYAFPVRMVLRNE